MYFEAGQHKQAGLRYNPFKALISPRPIGWISSCDADGHANLAPYSFFNAISQLPPMVMFVSAPDSRTGQAPDVPVQKDSLANIRQTGEFGVNIVGLAQRDDMVASSAMFPPEIDEFEEAGLAKMTGKHITAPLVKDAPAHLECRLHDIIDLPGTVTSAGCVMVIGHVLALHIQDDVIVDGKVDVRKFQPVARLGYKDYCTVSELYEMF